MEDIVTRLRRFGDSNGLDAEAADEIERLREENKRLVSLQKVLDLLYEHD